MKTRLWGIAIVLLCCAAAIGCVSYGYHETVSMGQPRPPVVRAGGSDQPFYDDLAPHGRWVFVSGPGWVWSPDSVQADWRPYRLGHWVFTDYGWTWASDEEWGWAVYHYGRWHLDSSHGWVWVPGTEWGPAWVAWHEGGGYVGWAPLPWQVRFTAEVGLDWGGVSVTIAPSWWCFASARHLVDPGLRTHILPPARNVNLIRVTQNVTNYTYIDNRIINQGVKVEKIGRAVGHTIPRYRVADTDSRETTRGGKVRGQDFVVFRADPVRGRNSHGRDPRHQDEHGDWRDRKSQDRVDPPGHDDRDSPRDDRPGPPRTEADPPANQPKDTPSQPDNVPPPTNRGQEKQDHGRDSHPSRGRKFLEDLVGKQPPARAPQKSAPAQSGGSNEGASESPRSSDPNDRSSGTRPNNSGPDNQQSATTAPGKAASGKAQPAQESARDKAKPGKDAASKGRKPKQDAPKPDKADDDKSKEDKPDPGN
jgi:hypothetical protein